MVVRIRPALPRELHGHRPFENAVLVDPSRRVVTLSENLAALSNNGVENGIVSSQAAMCRGPAYCLALPCRSCCQSSAALDSLPAPKECC